MSGKTSVGRRKLGQHFLSDTNVVDRIVKEAGIGKDDKVLEIGPGKGVLTKALLATGAEVTAIELDSYLYNKLKEEMGDEDRLSLVRANALKYDFENFGDHIRETSNRPDAVELQIKVVSNLPYSVSVPIIEKLVSARGLVKSMTLMVQEEVGRRLVAKNGEHGYGSLSVFCDYHCIREYLFKVPPSAFRPEPSVDSAVISLVPRDRPPVDINEPDVFFRFVRQAFMHRRKTLYNNLKRAGFEGGKIIPAMEKSGMESKARPEETSLKNFAMLYNSLNK